MVCELPNTSSIVIHTHTRRDCASTRLGRMENAFICVPKCKCQNCVIFGYSFFAHTSLDVGTRVFRLPCSSFVTTGFTIAILLSLLLLRLLLAVWCGWWGLSVLLSTGATLPCSTLGFSFLVLFSSFLPFFAAAPWIDVLCAAPSSLSWCQCHSQSEMRHFT